MSFRLLHRIAFTAKRPNKVVRWVASSAHDRNELQKRATAAVGILKPSCADLLVQYLHQKDDAPEPYASSFQGLQAWLAARHCAIFEILFFIGNPAIPAVKRIAFGQYDWTQGNAIEILCRWYAAGVNLDSTFDDLKRSIPLLRDEALYYAARPLSLLAKNDPALSSVVAELCTIATFREAYERADA